MTLDGARFPLKSAEHARRNKADTRAATIAEAEKADQAGDAVAANELYRKLVYPAHDAVYDWLVAFCRSVSAPGKVKLIQAPFEADSQCARLVRERYADAALTVDSDFFTYGAGRVLFSDAKAKDRFHSCGLDDILGHVFGDIDFTTCTLPEFTTLCVAAGCDYLQRVHYMTWPRLSELRLELRARPLLGRKIIKKFPGHGDFEGVVFEYDSSSGYRVYYHSDGQLDDLSASEIRSCLQPRAATSGELQDRERFIAVMSVRNARAPINHRRGDYETTFQAACDAFSDPLAWLPDGPVESRVCPDGSPGKVWPAEPPGVRLVGAISTLDPAATPSHPINTGDPELDASIAAGRAKLTEARQAAQTVVNADASMRLALCTGTINGRTELARELPDLNLDENTPNGDLSTVAVPTVKMGDDLTKFTMNQLQAWMTWKLNTTLSPEMRANKSACVEHTQLILDLIQDQGAAFDFAQRRTTMVALGQWLEPTDTLTGRMPVDDPATIMAMIKSLDPIELMYNNYMPASFEATYKRAYGQLEGFGLRVESMRATRDIFNCCNKEGEVVERRLACTVTMETGASQKLGTVYTATIGFVLPERAQTLAGPIIKPGWVLHAPASDCTCPAGICCAHGLAVMMGLEIMQKASTWDEFCQKCPTFSEATKASSECVLVRDVYPKLQRRSSVKAPEPVNESDAAVEAAANTAVSLNVQQITETVFDRLHTPAEETRLWRPEVEPGSVEMIRLYQKYYKPGAPED